MGKENKQGSPRRKKPYEPVNTFRVLTGGSSMVVIAGLPPQSWNRGRLAVPSVGGRVGSVVQVLHLNDGQYFVSAKMCSQWPSNSPTNLSRTHTCVPMGKQMRGFIELFVACNSKVKTIPELRLETVLRFLIWTLS